MLRGREHGHIYSNFRNNADCGKGLDTRRRHNKAQLRKVFLCGSKDKGFKVQLAQFKITHVGTDDAKLFSLLGTHLSVHGGKHLFIGCFHALGSEAGNIRDFLRGVLQNPDRNRRRCFTKYIREHIVQFEVGNSQAVLCPVFSPVVKLVSFHR